MSLGLIPEMRNSAALRYFYEVAQHGSFRAASDAVHIATSAISRQIRLLEADLGVDLFDRGPGRDGVRLTSAGETLLFRLRLAMRELSTAHAEIQSLRGLQQGHVTLGFNDSLARDFGVRFVQSFATSYPSVTVNTIIGNTPALTEQLLGGEIDIVVAYGIPDRSDIRRGLSFDTSLHLMVPIGHDWATRSEIAVAELAGRPMILPDPSVELRQSFDRLLERNDIALGPVMTSNSFETMADLVAAELGIGIQVRPAVRADPHRPNLRYVPVADRSAPRGTLSCCLGTTRSPSLAVRTCLERLTAALPALVEATPSA